MNKQKKSFERIGIMGSKGFLGSRLLRILDKENIKYVCFEGNLLVEKDIIYFFKNYKVNQVIDLVGIFEPPFETLVNINLLTTQKLLDIGIKYGLKKIIYASSGAIYGEPYNGYKSHESDIPAPNTLYGLSKLYAEECIKYYSRIHELKYVILRFPNVYDEHGSKGVVGRFLNDINEKGKVIVEGSGNQKRDFLHASDACISIIAALNHYENEIFNISVKKSLSINDLISILKLHHSFTIEYSEKKNNLDNLSLDITKAEEKLKFKPKFKIFRI